MTRLVWDQTGERLYRTGVNHGVIYPFDATGKPSVGEAWNGLTSVANNASGGEATAIYADNIKYLNLMSEEEESLTIGAYTYPESFEECDGSKAIAKGVYVKQQTRKHFGFCYTNQVGNDLEGSDYGKEIHLIYNCLASPSEKSYSTINESPEAIEFSWEATTTKVDPGIDGIKPTASLVIDSTKTDAAKMKALEDILYGTEDQEPRLPSIAEVLALVGETAGEVTEE